MTSSCGYEFEIRFATEAGPNLQRALDQFQCRVAQRRDCQAYASGFETVTR
jgi:hypothetical protein